MRFSAPVFFDDQENIFLAEGKEIRKFHLQALIRWNIEYVFTYGQLLMKSEDNSEKSLVEELPEVEELENLEEVDDLEPLDDLEELEAADEVDGFLEVVKLEQVVDQLPDMIVEYEPAKAMIGKYAESVAQMTLFFGEYKNNENIQRAVVDNVSKCIFNMVSDKKNGAMSFILNKVKNLLWLMQLWILL